MKGSYSPIPFAENLKGYGRIPGPFGLPIVGNVLSFASFTPEAHLVWTKWAETFGKIYKYDFPLSHEAHLLALMMTAGADQAASGIWHGTGDPMACWRS